MEIIYTITTVKPNNNTRCVGWYPNINDALSVFENNYGDIAEEGYYRFGVIEEFHYGIYQQPEHEQWFMWRHDLKKWINCEKPAQYKRTCNFGIG